MWYDTVNQPLSLNEGFKHFSTSFSRKSAAHLSQEKLLKKVFPGSSVGKESACNVGYLGLIPGLGRSPGEGKGYPSVFWPGEFHGLYSPWGREESDMTKQLSLSLS